MRSLRRVITALVALVVLTALAWAIGLEPAPALLAALSVVAIAGLRQLPGTNHDEDWPPLPDVGSDQGVRREVARLSWSLQGHESRVERPSLLRLRTLADDRLRRFGLHLDEPADRASCEARLGVVAHRTLMAGPRAHITFEDFTRSLSAVEELTEERGVGAPERLERGSRRG